MRKLVPNLKFLVFIVCSIAAFAHSAQGANQDSLLRALEAAPEKSGRRAEILLQLCQIYLNTSPSECLRYSRSLIEEGRQIGAPYYEGNGLSMGGVCLAKLGRLDEALDYFHQGLKLAQGFDSPEWKIRQIKNRINIVGIYWEQGESGQALEYAHANLRDLQELRDSALLADAYQSMALLQQNAAQPDSSIYYSKQAMAWYDALGLSMKMQYARLTLARTYLMLGEPKQAIELLQMAIAYAEENNHQDLAGELYPTASRAYRQAGQLALALDYARRSMASNASSEQPKIRLASNEAMYKYFLAVNRYDSALFYHQAMMELREQILNEEKVKRIQELEISFQTQQKEREIEGLQQRNAASRRTNRILLLSSALLLGLMALTFFFYLRLQRRKQQLESLHWEAANLNARLLSLMDEKKHVIGLITHDIRTPLSLIQLNTFLLAQSNSLNGEERQQALREIEQATDEINAAGLKIMELENKTLEKEFLSEELIEAAPLIEQVAQEFQVHARNKSITLAAILPPSQTLIFGDPFLLRHILANLLSNAFKFSPPQGRVEIRLQALPDKTVIQVADQGPGLSAEAQQQLFEKKRKTLLHPVPPKGKGSWGQGLYLANRFVQAMGGQLAVESKPGEGATFSVSFPTTS